MGGEFTYPKMGSQKGLDNHSDVSRWKPLKFGSQRTETTLVPPTATPVETLWLNQPPLAHPFVCPFPPIESGQILQYCNQNKIRDTKNIEPPMTSQPAPRRKAPNFGEPSPSASFGRPPGAEPPAAAPGPRTSRARPGTRSSSPGPRRRLSGPVVSRRFLDGFPMGFPWFSVGFPWVGHGFPLVFCGFPMGWPWVSHGFAMVFHGGYSKKFRRQCFEEVFSHGRKSVGTGYKPN